MGRWTQILGRLSARRIALGFLILGGLIWLLALWPVLRLLVAQR